MSGGKQAGITSLAGADQPDADDASAASVPLSNSPEPAEPADTSPQEAPRHHGLPPSVIHELRTPLTSIHGYAQVLQRTLRNEPRTANATAVIARESVRLSEMFALLSELSELENGEVSAAPIAVEVGQIVEGIVHEVQRRDSHAHPIEVSGSAVAVCNPTLLGQAMMHILTNAVRYSEDGQPVAVTIDLSDGAVRIAVRDAGMGIPTEDATRAYGAFERGSNARLAGIRGLGLGLYLARRALRMTGGGLSHEQALPGGTVFRVTLPDA